MNSHKLTNPNLFSRPITGNHRAPAILCARPDKMESIISRARGASRETISEMWPQFFAWVEQLFRNRLMPSKLSAINKLMRTIFHLAEKPFKRLIFVVKRKNKKRKKKKGAQSFQTRNFFREIFEAFVKSILSRGVKV